MFRFLSSIRGGLSSSRFTEEGIIIFKNFVSLGVGQLLLVIIPVILYPIILRRFGEENLALYIYIVAIGAITSQFIEFGFDSLNLKRFSEDKSPEVTVKNIQNSIFAKLVIWTSSCFLLVIAASLNNSMTIAIIVSFISLEAVFFNPWYFQVLNRTKLIPIHQIVSRVLILFFAFVTASFEIFLFLSASASFISIIINFAFTYKLTKLRFNKNLVSWEFQKFNFIDEIKLGAMFFISRFSAIAGAKTVQIIGFKLVDPSIIIVLDFLEKILGIASLLFGTANQAVIASVFRKRSISKSFSMIVYATFASVILSIVIRLSGTTLGIWYFGEKNQTYESLLTLYIFNIPLLAFNYFSGITFLVPFGYSYYFNFSTILGFCFIMISIIFMTFSQMLLSPLVLVIIILTSNLMIAGVRLLGIMRILKRQKDA